MKLQLVGSFGSINFRPKSQDQIVKIPKMAIAYSFRALLGRFLIQAKHQIGQVCNCFCVPNMADMFAFFSNRPWVFQGAR